MKILHLGKYYSPIEGGIESINKVVVDAMKGHQQWVVSFSPTKESSVDEVDGVKVYRSGTYKVVKSQPISTRYFWDLKRLFKEVQPDVVHFHYPNPLVGLYLLNLIPKNVKLIVHWHSDVVSQSKLQKLVAPVEQRLLRRADVVIATSENYRDSSFSLRNHKDKVCIIPCSIDETQFNLTRTDTEKVEEIKNHYGNKPIVFFLGRHVEYKGLKYLLEAINSITSDYSLIIGGRGPLTAELKPQGNRGNIFWVGRIPEEEMKIYYHAADILAFPSITRNEAFGVVLAEAMYCGTPAVTFTIDGSGVNWVAQNGETAIEVENRNTKEYAKALDLLLRDEPLRKKLGEHAKERIVANFTNGKVETLYRNLYNSLMNSQSH